MGLKFGDMRNPRDLEHLPAASVLLKVLKRKSILSFCKHKILVIYVQTKSNSVFFTRILKAKKYYEQFIMGSIGTFELLRKW